MVQHPYPFSKPTSTLGVFALGALLWALSDLYCEQRFINFTEDVLALCDPLSPLSTFVHIWHYIPAFQCVDAANGILSSRSICALTEVGA